MSYGIELKIGVGCTSGEVITCVVRAPAGREPSAVMQLDVQGLLLGAQGIETTMLVESEMNTLVASNVIVARADSGTDVRIVSTWSSHGGG
jgi:hypothetical protein